MTDALLGDAAPHCTAVLHCAAVLHLTAATDPARATDWAMAFAARSGSRGGGRLWLATTDRGPQ